MTGKTHKAIGFVAGMSLAIYLVSTTGNPSAILSVATATAGAMLPDIDHDNSKIGSQRKKIVDTASKTIVGVSVATVVGLGVYAFMTKNIQALLISVASILTLMAFSLLAKNPKIKAQMNFFVKHRGIMHTAVVPCLFLCSSFVFKGNGLVNNLFLGAAIGYFSHLLADSLTVQGTPILWPVTKKNISLLPIRTGTTLEYITGALLCGGMLWLTFAVLK